jgi:hypothetical protein
MLEGGPFPPGFNFNLFAGLSEDPSRSKDGCLATELTTILLQK